MIRTITLGNSVPLKNTCTTKTPFYLPIDKGNRWYDNWIDRDEFMQVFSFLEK